METELKWHYALETDMEYYGWKRGQLALHNGKRQGISWMETEPIGIITWKRNIMDGNRANWHYLMETDMEYFGWKRSQVALYNGNGHGYGHG